MVLPMIKFQIRISQIRRPAVSEFRQVQFLPLLSLQFRGNASAGYATKRLFKPSSDRSLAVGFQRVVVDEKFFQLPISVIGWGCRALLFTQLLS